MKKLLFLAATAAIAMSSCSKNEVSDIAAPSIDPSVVGLSLGTFATKAETNAASLITSDLVTIYSTEENLNELSFVYETSAWAQASGGEKKWADSWFTNGSIPLYSLHNGTTPLAVTASTGKADAAFTVAGSAADQTDLVYYAAKIAAVPSSGNISATFKHALSRVKFATATSSESITADVKLINLCKLNNTGTPTLYAATSSVDWGATSGTATYANDVENDLFIIPQTTAYTTGGAAPADNGSIVTALFYTKTSDAAIVGYESATAYKQKNPNAKLSLTDDETNKPDTYTGALYVKAAFPLAYTFIAGTYYTLTLNFSGTSVLVAEEGYFSADGAPIYIYDADEEEPGVDEPINPDAADTEIGLTVTVSSWGDTVAEDNLTSEE